MLLNEEASTCSQTNAAKHPADIVIHLRRFMSGRIGRSHLQRQSGNRFASNLFETNETWQRTISASRVEWVGQVGQLSYCRKASGRTRAAALDPFRLPLRIILFNAPPQDRRPRLQHLSTSAIVCRTAYASRPTMMVSPRCLRELLLVTPCAIGHCVVKSAVKISVERHTYQQEQSESFFRLNFHEPHYRDHPSSMQQHL